MLKYVAFCRETLTYNMLKNSEHTLQEEINLDQISFRGSPTKCATLVLINLEAPPGHMSSSRFAAQVGSCDLRFKY